MKLIHAQLFTYKDVRDALNSHFNLGMAGVRICVETGYLVEECSKTQEPASAKVEEEQEAQPHA